MSDLSATSMRRKLAVRDSPRGNLNEMRNLRF